MTNISVPINIGSSPDVIPQITNPRLVNMYVGEGGLYRLPFLDLFSKIPEAVSFIKTQFLGGSYIIATRTAIVRMDFTGNVQNIGHISSSSDNIRIDENSDNQVTITTGTAAYVFDQKKANFQRLTTKEGFDLNNPVGVIVINTRTIIVGGSDQKWTVSDTNNALVYNTNDIVITDTSIGNLTGVQELHNNLYIFGEEAIQKWMASIERTTYDFPFTLDTGFRTAYGCTAPASITSTGADIYFLGNNNIVQALDGEILHSVTSSGISKSFDKFEKIQNATGAYFFYNNAYFYSLTFDELSWVWCEDSKRWSESTSLIKDANADFVVTKDGIFSLSNVFKENVYLEFIGSNILPKGISSYNRNSVNEVNVNITQGLESIPEPQFMDLSISIDNVEFSNAIRREIAKTGKRKGVNIWKMNIAANQFTIKLRYDGKLNFAIEKINLLMN